MYAILILNSMQNYLEVRFGVYRFGPKSSPEFIWKLIHENLESLYVVFFVIYFDVSKLRSFINE